MKNYNGVVFNDDLDTYAFQCYCGKVYDVEEDEHWHYIDFSKMFELWCPGYPYEKCLDRCKERYSFWQKDGYICEDCLRGLSISSIIIERNLWALEPKEHGKIVNKILEENPKQVKQYKEGNKKVINFLLGKCKKEGEGKVFGDLIFKLLEEKLDKVL